MYSRAIWTVLVLTTAVPVSLVGSLPGRAEIPETLRHLDFTPAPLQEGDTTVDAARTTATTFTRAAGTHLTGDTSVLTGYTAGNPDRRLIVVDWGEKGSISLDAETGKIVHFVDNIAGAQASAELKQAGKCMLSEADVLAAAEKYLDLASPLYPMQYDKTTHDPGSSIYSVFFDRVYEGYRYRSSGAFITVDCVYGRLRSLIQSPAFPMPASLRINFDYNQAVDIAADFLQFTGRELDLPPDREAPEKPEIVSPNYAFTPFAGIYPFTRLAWVVSGRDYIIWVDAETGEVLGGPPPSAGAPARDTSKPETATAPEYACKPCAAKMMLDAEAVTLVSPSGREARLAKGERAYREVASAIYNAGIRGGAKTDKDPYTIKFHLPEGKTETARYHRGSGMLRIEKPVIESIDEVVVWPADLVKIVDSALESGTSDK